MNFARPIDVRDDLARDPFAAEQSEHHPVHPGKQLHVLDGRLGDPALSSVNFTTSGLLSNGMTT